MDFVNITRADRLRQRKEMQLQEMRNTLHNYFDFVIPQLTKDLLEYADNLDIAYEKIKISKIAGSASGVVGGVLGVVGFGLSFFTFGASLGLCIAGGAIGGLGGLTAGGASIGEFFEVRNARSQAKEQLETFEKATKEVLIKCRNIAKELEHNGKIEMAFPSWFTFWKTFVFGADNSVANLGWEMIATTIIHSLHLTKAADIAGDVSSVAVPVVRTLGKTAKGVHIVGGVAGIILLPVDVYSLVSNSIELHNGEAHDVSKRIRKIVEEIQRKCLKVHQIDGMINDTISALSLFN